MTGDLVIRDATPADEERWRELWAGYLTFYEATLSDDVTSATWSRILDPDVPVDALVAERGGQVAGFAVYVVHPIPWSAEPACLLHDLFVDPATRSGGAGRALIDALIARARAEGWARVYWVTKHDNERARLLYDQYGPADGFIRYTVKLQ